MTQERTLSEDEVVEADGAGAARTAVVVAMKPQLRGRFRRNVETLLEMGLRVVVVSVRSRKEFFVGLESPLLSAELVDVPTFYKRFAIWSQRDGIKRQYVRQLRLDRARRRHVRGTLRRRHRPLMMLRYLANQPRYGIPYGGKVTPFPRWLVYLLLGVIAPLAFIGGLVHVVTSAVGSAARAVARAIRPGADESLDRASESGSRVLHGAVKSVLRALRPAARFVRARVVAPITGGWTRLRERTVALVLRRLLAVHRVEGFVRFWAISARHVKAVRPDVVVSSDLPGLVGASRAAKALGIRQVHDCHELFLESTSFKRWEQRLLKPIERRHMLRTERIVVVNESIASEYRERYGVRTSVVRNCANVEVGHGVKDIRELAGLEAGTPVVLYQGGFMVGRGLDVCIAAMADVRQDAHLVMLGYGPMVAELAALAEEHGVAERFHVVPAVPPEELLSLTQSATVGLIPYQPVSKNNYYTLPNKIFEYTSVGLPVVASDLPELRRVVTDGGCGQVYDPYDAQSLSKAIATVLDPARYDEFRAAAQEYGLVNSWVNERLILVGAFEQAIAAGVQRRAPGRGTAR